jgi:RNA polymerase sigma factor (sigma-70 family)
VFIAKSSHATGTHPQYSARELLYVARKHYLEDQTAQEITAEIGGKLSLKAVRYAIGLVHDIAMVLNTHEIDPAGNVSDRYLQAQRILGFAPFEKRQCLFSLTSKEQMMVFDPSSELNQKWVFYLQELGNDACSKGEPMSVDPYDAIELVRLVYVEGYTYRFAASIIGIREDINPLRVAFVSLLLLRDLCEESNVPISSIIPPKDKNLSRYEAFVVSMREIAHEKQSLAVVVSDLKERYTRTSEKHPFLNPLQLALLDDYVAGVPLDQIYAYVAPHINMTFRSFKVVFGQLRRFALGHAFDKRHPFKNEFRRVFLLLSVRDDTPLSMQIEEDRLLIRMLKFSSREFTSGTRLARQVGQTHKTFAEVLQKDLFETFANVIRTKAHGRIIPDTLRYKGADVTVFEREALAYYFPTYAPVMPFIFATDSKGYGLTKFLDYRYIVFTTISPDESWTEDQRTSWEYACIRNSIPRRDRPKEDYAQANLAVTMYVHHYAHLFEKPLEYVYEQEIDYLLFVDPFSDMFDKPGDREYCNDRIEAIEELKDPFLDDIELRDILRIPLLSIEGERVITLRACLGDKQAVDRLVLSNLRLARSVAHRQCRLNESMDLAVDVRQEANLALHRAVQLFDPRRIGYIKFSTYAYSWLRKFSLDYLYRRGRIRNAPRYYKQVNAIISTRKQLGLEPLDTRELAILLLPRSDQKYLHSIEGVKSVTSEQIRVAKRIEAKIRRRQVYVLEIMQFGKVLSLEQTDVENENPLIERTEDPNADVIGNVVYSLTRTEIEEVLDTLTPREALVIKWRFGFMDGKYHILDDIAKKFGLTRERIRQIEKKALRRLRHPRRSRRLKDFL